MAITVVNPECSTRCDVCGETFRGQPAERIQRMVDHFVEVHGYQVLSDGTKPRTIGDRTDHVRSVELLAPEE